MKWAQTNWQSAIAYRVVRENSRGKTIELGVHTSKTLAQSIAKRERSGKVIPVKRIPA
jgi:uncharacterized UPF0146 family protein